ncbi:MAG: permease [Sebaldella sp.]|nr:permease [Sebaldella sp.]
MGIFIKGFNYIMDIFFKMTWLNDLSGFIVQKILKLDLTSQIGGSVQFFLFDTIKIFILLTILIYGISYIQSYFPPERTKKLLGNMKGIKGRVVGALLGTITPFCSCSSIPIFIGFTASGLPLGTTFSFLISSPLVDLGSFLLLMSFFGFKIAFIYVLVGLVLAVVGGSIIDRLNLETQVEDYVREMPNVDGELETMTKRKRHEFSKEQVKEIFKKVWPYVIIGVGIGALIHNWIPQELIENLIGNNNKFAVLISTILGMPMYADIFGTIPIAEALFSKGVGIGTILSFMMAVTALSLPSIIMLSKVVKAKLLTIFILIVGIGIIIIGYFFNFFGYMFI